MDTSSLLQTLLAEAQDLPSEVRNRIQAKWQKRPDRWAAYADDTLTWLAVAPVWTPALAEATRLPSPTDKLQALFEQAVLDGLCEAQPEVVGKAAPATRSYWMPEAHRLEVLQRLGQKSDFGVARVHQELARVGRALLQIEPIEQVPESLVRWRQLAALVPPTGETQELGILFRQKVDEILPQRDTVQVPDAQTAAQTVAGVLRWIEAGRSLATLLGGALLLEVERAGRRVELYSRRLDDLRRLEVFLPRDEAIQAFHDLLSSPPNEWALHLCGVGGAGKTMLLRYFNVKLGPELGLATTRIDFDHLHPDYPTRTPGLLLIQLAEELRLQDENTAAQSYFLAFDDKVKALHERLGSAQVSDAVLQENPLAAIETPEFYGILDTFAEALRGLQKQVVLLIDTCEELSKLRADGKPLNNVTATFAILNHLHERVEKLRVVFGGRRPLASAGAGGWKAFKAESLPARDYLRLYELFGFTTKETRDYLNLCRERAKEVVGRPPATRSAAPVEERIHVPDAVLPTWDAQAQAVAERSRLPNPKPLPVPEDREATERFSYPKGKRPVQVDRHNPYEVSRLAMWLQDDPSAAPEKLRQTGSDEYITDRIIGQVKHSTARELLPAVALLGRFDEDMFQALTEDPGVGAAYQELRALDWTDVVGGFVEVAPWMLNLLRRYYQRPDRHHLQTLPRQRAAAYLEQFTLDEKNWDRLDARHLDTAVRLLESAAAPTRMVRWWQQFELLVAKRGTYHRICEWSRFLLGDDGVAHAPTDEAPTTSVLRPAVLALRAAALMQQAAGAEARSTWDEVAAAAVRYPDAAGRVQLQRRAVAGAVTAGRFLKLPPDQERMRAWLNAVDDWCAGEVVEGPATEQLAASFLAAAEALVECARDHTPAPAAERALRSQCLHGISGRFLDLTNTMERARCDPCLCAFASLLAGRALLLDPSHPPEVEATARFERALEAVQRLPSANGWMDWPAPDSVADRICLEYLQAIYPDYLAADEALDRVNRARGITTPPVRWPGAVPGPIDFTSLPAPTNPDADRFGGAQIRLCTSLGVFAEETLEPLDRSEPSNLIGTIRCQAHRESPRRFVAETEALAARGEIDAAMALLRRNVYVAQKSAQELDTIQDVDRAVLRIRRRMRHFDWGEALNLQVPQAALFGDRAMRLAVEALDWPRLPGPVLPPRAPADLTASAAAFNHVHWQGVFAGHAEMASTAIEWLRARTEEEATGTETPDEQEDFFANAWALDRLEAVLLGRRFRQRVTRRQVRVGSNELAAAWRRAANCANPTEALTLLLRLDALEQPLNAPPLSASHPTVRRLGLRRTAEIAFNHGELLALRLPARAARLLGHARQWFIAASDQTGALLAQACRALCWPRSRRTLGRKHLKPEVALLGRLYEERRHGPFKNAGTLPSWERLMALARQLEFGPLEELRSHAWAPWLYRILALLTWQCDGGRSGDRCGHLRQWLVKTFGPKSSEFASLPAELYGWFDAAPQDDDEEDDEETTLIPQNWVIDIEPADTSHQMTLTEAVAATISLEPSEDEPRVFDVQAVPTAPYADGLRVDGASEPERLRVTELLPAKGQARLRIHPTLTHLAWEAFFRRSTSDLAPEENLLKFYRTVSGARLPRQADGRDLANVFFFAAELSQEQLVREAWREFITHSSGALQQVHLNDLMKHPSDNSESPQILHLVGKPIPTSQGIALQARRTSSGRRTRGDLLIPNLLAPWLRRLTLCVVQSSYLSGSPRTGTDREQAGYLRRLAAELYVCGVPLVLACPPLPQQMQHRVLRRLVQAIPHGIADDLTIGLLTAVQHAQREVLTGRHTTDLDADLLEIANDFCLYSSLSEAGRNLTPAR